MPKVSRYGNNSNLIYIWHHRYVRQYQKHMMCHVMMSHACLRHTSFNSGRNAIKRGHHTVRGQGKTMKWSIFIEIHILSEVPGGLMGCRCEAKHERVAGHTME